MGRGMTNPVFDVELATTCDQHIRLHLRAHLDVLVQTILGLGFHLQRCGDTVACEEGHGAVVRYAVL